MKQNREPRNGPTTVWSTNLQQNRKDYPMEKSLFNKRCWENWTAICRRMKLDHSLTPYTKINSKCMKDLNVRQEILEENTGSSNLFDLGNFLQDMSLKARKTKAKMNFGDFIKIKGFCTAKEVVNKTKR